MKRDLTNAATLAMLSARMRRGAQRKRLEEKVPKPTLKWDQVDAREELARLVGAESQQKVDDAPPENED